MVGTAIRGQCRAAVREPGRLVVNAPLQDRDRAPRRRVVAYPVGFRGVVVGQGDTLDEALADVRSAIQFHLETFDADLGEEKPLDIVLADLAIVA